MKNALFVFFLVVVGVQITTVSAEEKPTFTQMEEFFRLVNAGKITGSQFGEFLRTRAEKPRSHVSPVAYPIPNGWRVVEDVEPTDGNVDFVPFLENGENYVFGEAIRERAKMSGANLGLADAMRLLEGDQAGLKDAPREKYLVFAGTLLRNAEGSLIVAILDWYGGRWHLGFRRIDNVWYGNYRLARCN